MPVSSAAHKGAAVACRPGMTRMPEARSAWIKLSLLAHGLSSSLAFDTWFAGTSGYVRRRNFYNSPDWRGGLPSGLPQEIMIDCGAPVTVAVNSYGPSPWTLTWTPGAGPQLTGDLLPSGLPIGLPHDLASTWADAHLAQACNLYGGSALSFFSPRACSFFTEGTQCRFCSLEGTARENNELAARLSPAQVYEVVSAVVATDRDMLNQVMIVGGNERNLDRGFRNQLNLVQAATQALADAGLSEQISVHLVACHRMTLPLLMSLAAFRACTPGSTWRSGTPAGSQRSRPARPAATGRQAYLQRCTGSATQWCHTRPTRSS